MVNLDGLSWIQGGAGDGRERYIDLILRQWEMDARGLHRRLILAPTPRERERWHALWLLAQGWTAAATAEALGRDGTLTPLGGGPPPVGEGVRTGGLDVRADRGFSPPALGEDQKAELKTAVERPARVRIPFWSKSRLPCLAD